MIEKMDNYLNKEILLNEANKEDVDNIMNSFEKFDKINLLIDDIKGSVPIPGNIRLHGKVDLNHIKKFRQSLKVALDKTDKLINLLEQ